MKCLLHIGTEKTGTTVLQDWLYDNKAQLSRVGVYLSETLGKPNNRLIPAYFKASLDDWAWQNGIANEAEKEKYFDGFIERLKSEVLAAKKTHSVFVITSEHLSSRVIEREEIEQLYDFLVSVFSEVEVVCYFRDQFDLVVSLYSTALKLDSYDNIDSFVNQAKPEIYFYNYLKIADNWADVFGKHNCNFRIYDMSKFIDNDIRIDLLSVITGDIDIDLGTFNMARNSSNESLSLLQSAAFKAINRNIPYWASDSLSVNRDNLLAKRKLANMESLKLGKITSMKGELIRNRFAETNTLFFEKYFLSDKNFPVSLGESYNTMASNDAMNAVQDALEFGLRLNTNITSSIKNKIKKMCQEKLRNLFSFRNKW
jgi:hypothetical protein